ncbi:hypothetical protein Pfo_014543 [Paulownia fortunei]|nr:hypothetical protein Pfo_014543 [Paulownia fortunei]
MDFYRLTRRELQALCKMNKIPANMTNVAMADSLKALETVEGVEEFLQPCESETAQSSIESPVRSEVTSPYVPPTGGRSTRRRNLAKEEPETVKPLTRTQRTTRKTMVKYADESQTDAIETPAVVAQTNRKKGPIVSACRKMDSQLKECVEEEKKDALTTPAPLGVTSRRRRVVKEESTVKRVYSTRRSVRLAEKNVELLNEGNETCGLLKKDLFTNDGQNMKMNLKESSDDLDEISGITGVDANTTVEENSEKKDEVEEVSSQKNISAVNEAELLSEIEEEMDNHFEAAVNEAELLVKEGSDVEIEEVGFGFEIQAELDKQKYDKTEDPEDENIIMPLDVSNNAQENEGSHDLRSSEIEIAVENTEELNTDKDAGCEDKAADCIENVVLDNEDNFAVGEVSCDTDIRNEIEKEMYNDKDKDSEDVTDFNVTEEVLEINADVHVDLGEKEFNPDESSDSVILEAKEESTDAIYQSADESLADMTFDISLMNEEDGAKIKLIVPKCDAVIAIGEKNEMNLVKDTELELQQATEEVLHETKLDDVAVEEPGEIEIVQHEESKKVADQVPSDALGYLIDLPSCGEAVDDPLPSIKSSSPSKQLGGVVGGEGVPFYSAPLDLDADFPEHIPTSAMDGEVSHQIPPSFAGLDSSLIVQPTHLTPVKNSASKASVTMKRMTAVSDNKENIGSGSKLVLTKERVKIAKNTAENVPKLDDLSMRKLTKMLKEKLEITNKLSKNENDNEAPARPALQALPENRNPGLNPRLECSFMEEQS